jgi:glucose/arabinose dehydrogenase
MMWTPWPDSSGPCVVPRRAERYARVLIAVVLIVAACGPTRGSGTPPAEPSATRSEAPSAAPATSPPASPNTPAPDVRLETLFSDLATPIGLVVAPGVDDRAFIIEQTGRIHVVQGTERLPSPFLNLADRLVRLSRDYDERGLLGLAFHPEFATNGRLFVYYSTPASADAEPPVDHTNRLSEFTVGLDADAVDPDSERVILEFDQPQPNHSGGALGFGPDGLLYLGTGDGGGRGDADPGHSPQGNAQDPDKLNGKILRIDVGSEPDGSGTYAIPPDNPYAAGGGRPEIYASGFRNPWRLSWEPAGDRRLLVSDVGYGRYEEVDSVVAGGNYGWRIREGAHCLDIENPLADTTGCPTEGDDGNPLIDPVIEYTHAGVGIAVVGGYVYRGTALPALQGQYVFADYTPDWTTPDPDPHGTLLVATPAADTSTPWPWRRLSVADDALNHFFVTGMGEDAAGELYVMARHQFGPIGQTGFVFRIVPPVS